MPSKKINDRLVNRIQFKDFSSRLISTRLVNNELLGFSVRLKIFDFVMIYSQRSSSGYSNILILFQFFTFILQNDCSLKLLTKVLYKFLYLSRNRKEKLVSFMLI